jgi:hypothetical protein
MTIVRAAQVPASATLTHLWEVVRDHSEHRRRFPKWKFRIAEDLVIEIQPEVPKPSAKVKDNALRFEGMAYAGAGIGIEAFTMRGADNYPYYGTGFTIKDWYVWFNRSRWPKGLSPYQRLTPVTVKGALATASFEEREEAHRRFREEFEVRKQKADIPINELRVRVVAAFNDGFFEHVHRAALLGSHCFICGRGLTDPASRGRFIGPECFGSSSINLPWITEAMTEEAA